VNAVVGKLLGAQLGSAFGYKLGEVLGETKTCNGARGQYGSRCRLARRNGIGSGTAVIVDVGATLGAKLSSGLGTAANDVVGAELGYVLRAAQRLKR
jgi:hypothetical protein